MIDRSLAEYDESGTQTVFPISDGTETRAERIARMEKMGLIDPNCGACKEFYAHPSLDPFAPRHKPGGYCRSGGRPHCTCPTCWG